MDSGELQEPVGAHHLTAIYPECAAGGYTRIDGTIQFYQRVRAIAERSMTVLDFGAGRGEFLDDRVSWRRNLRLLRGSVARVVGVDIDPIVALNPALDEAHVVDPQAKTLPFADASFDMIVSDWTLEHVADADMFAAEAARLLKPGGWLCARTPNKWGYIGLGARLMPNRAHKRMLKVLQPDRRSEDVFPTTYRMNTLGALKRVFPQDRFQHCSFIWTPEPAYFGKGVAINWVMAQVLRCAPEPLGAVLMIFIQKRATAK